MIRHACIALIAASAMGWSALAQAQPYQTTFHVGPTFGIHTQNGASESDHLWGATARLKLAPWFGIDGSAAYRQDELGGDAGWIKTWPLMVTGLVYPIPYLYGGLGGGWHNTTYDFSNQLNELGIDDETHGDFGWHLAVGTEIPASTWLKLMADVRWVFLNSDPTAIPDVVDEELVEDFRVISFGLLFAL